MFSFSRASFVSPSNTLKQSLTLKISQVPLPYFQHLQMPIIQRPLEQVISSPVSGQHPISFNMFFIVFQPINPPWCFLCQLHLGNFCICKFTVLCGLFSFLVCMKISPVTMKSLFGHHGPKHYHPSGNPSWVQRPESILSKLFPVALLNCSAAFPDGLCTPLKPARTGSACLSHTVDSPHKSPAAL